MTIHTVTDRETKVTYQTGVVELGAGATAQVWLGTTVDDPRQTVAIKIAHRGMAKEYLADFWSELDLLNLLGKSAVHNCVPWAHKGFSEDDPDRAIIIMEHIGRESLLSKLVNQDDRNLPEELVLESAFQYAQLLMVIHELSYTMRGDRKVADFYLIPQKEGWRLVVLDWNRVRMIPDNAPSQNRAELKRQDIRSFGQIWAEYALGRQIAQLPAVDEINDARWASISRGLRTILSRSVQSRAGWGYQSASELFEDLKWYRGIIRIKEEDSIEALLMDARKIRTDIEQSIFSAPNIKLVNKLLIITDVILSKAQEFDKEEVYKLQTWAEQQASSLHQETIEAIQQIHQCLMVRDNEGAQQIVQTTLQRFQAQSSDSQQAYLRLLRWSLVTHVGTLCDEHRIDAYEQIRSLSDSLMQLEQVIYSFGQPADQVMNSMLRIFTPLEHTINTLPDFVKEKIQPLMHELNLHISLAQVRQKRARGEDFSREQAQVITYWHELEKINRPYAVCLQSENADLDREMSMQMMQNWRQKENQNRQVQLSNAIREVSKALNSTGCWRDLTTEIQALRDQLFHIGSLDDYDQTRNDILSWINEIALINECFITNKISGIIDRHVITSSSPSEEYEYKLLQQRVAKAARAKLEQIRHKVLWPDEIKQAYELIQVLQALPPSIEHNEKELEVWRQELQGINEIREELFKELREIFGEIEVSPEFFLTNLDNVRIDQILEESRSTYFMQLYDRPGMTNLEASYQVETLITARRSARLVYYLNDIAANLIQLATALQEENKRFEESLILSNDILRQAQRFELMLRRPEHTLLIDRAEAYSRRIKSIEEGLSKAKQITDQFNVLSQQVFQHENEILHTIKKQKNIEDQFENIRSKTEDMENKIKLSDSSFSQIENYTNNTLIKLLNIQISHGFYAIRQLNLDKENGAQSFLENAIQISKQLPTDRVRDNIIEQLRGSVNWLETIYRRQDLYEVLRNYLESINLRDLEKADEAFKQFQGLTVNVPSLREHWLITELQDEYRMLCRSRNPEAQQGRFLKRIWPQQ
ncbi:protein kinase [Candidatus Chloroploca sp. M-50]|uniref:Protein kinase n=1 Tax=Candidatus Chloroploca mongolica TaxID=2528176 RepID=A0ABS4D4U9_9CHLR|nr:protein kinase [Candidatus Chloroploca mongolica]MBP1464454.1 protein kinase [Candidatus Chloroploca mongolica]